MKHNYSRSEGFTLVEIMIVVAIIGMLATIAIPNYVKSRETARLTTCVNNLQKIDGVIAQWALELKKDSGQPVTYDDIRGYLKGSVVCPSGGTSFQDSYTITTVDTAPLCLRRPEAHKLPL
jgi:prepilin-type N-terminal cleavage/methylation domain-containing protein